MRPPCTICAQPRNRAFGLVCRACAEYECEVHGRGLPILCDGKVVCESCHDAETCAVENTGCASCGGEVDCGRTENGCCETCAVATVGGGA
jgi:hypothetical protein